MRYEYCPKCGKKLTDRPAGDDGKVPYCEACEKYWFDSFASCVIIQITNEYDEIVLLRQSYMSDEYRNYVSGYMVPGENAEEAALREVREETGLQLDSLEYGGTWWYGEGDMLMHGFFGSVKKQDFHLSPEVDSADWIPWQEAPKYMYPDMPGNAQQGLYRIFVKRKKEQEA
ncbi:MAG: NUDIX domain-containing protein [Firmicutes bacterium]|nr:NUDIX domain-containing protein [Bacillota bacterium]